MESTLGGLKTSSTPTGGESPRQQRRATPHPPQKTHPGDLHAQPEPWTLHRMSVPPRLRDQEEGGTCTSPEAESRTCLSSMDRDQDLACALLDLMVNDRWRRKDSDSTWPPVDWGGVLSSPRTKGPGQSAPPSPPEHEAGGCWVSTARCWLPFHCRAAQRALTLTSPISTSPGLSDCTWAPAIGPRLHTQHLAVHLLDPASCQLAGWLELRGHSLSGHRSADSCHPPILTSMGTTAKSQAPGVGAHVSVCPPVTSLVPPPLAVLTRAAILGTSLHLANSHAPRGSGTVSALLCQTRELPNGGTGPRLWSKHRAGFRPQECGCQVHALNH